MSYAKDLMTDPTPPHPLSDVATGLRIGVFRFARRMRTERAVDSMSDGQFGVLAGLFLHGPHTLGELAERERVSAPSMNRTANCLQELGYISRSADESDGRKVVITITDAGRTVVEETTKRRDAWVERALAELSDHERDILADAAVILRRMAER